MAFNMSFENNELCVWDTVSGRKWKGCPCVIPVFNLDNELIKNVVEKLSANSNIMVDNKLVIDSLEINIEEEGSDFKITVFNPCSIQALQKSIVIKVPEVILTDFEKMEFLIKKNTALIRNDIAELKQIIIMNT